MEEIKQCFICNPEDKSITSVCNEHAMSITKIDIKNDLYLEPLNFDFDTASVVSDLYMFQESINNIIEVLNKITNN